MSATENLPALTLDITQDTAPAIFQGKGLDRFYDHIKASVNEVPDLSTKKGRDRVASLAAQVSRSKTAVEKPGRDYLKRIKEMPKLIEGELRDFVTKCDALRDEVRKPLTDWENTEKERIAKHEMFIEMISNAASGIGDFSAYTLLNNIAALELTEIGEEQEEFESEAHRAKATSLAALKEALVKRKQFEAEQAELERLRAEVAAREQQELAERMRLEAIEQERRRQEAQAAAEAEETRRREANKEHKKRLNGEALADMIAAGLTDEMARAAITAIAKRQVRHIAINY